MSPSRGSIIEPSNDGQSGAIAARSEFDLGLRHYKIRRWQYRE